MTELAAVWPTAVSGHGRAEGGGGGRAREGGAPARSGETTRYSAWLRVGDLLVASDRFDLGVEGAVAGALASQWWLVPCESCDLAVPKGGQRGAERPATGTLVIAETRERPKPRCCPANSFSVTMKSYEKRGVGYFMTVLWL